MNTFLTMLDDVLWQIDCWLWNQNWYWSAHNWWHVQPAVYLRHFRQWFSRHILGWCDVCGGLACVFGRAVGQHWNCDELPF